MSRRAAVAVDSASLNPSVSFPSVFASAFASAFAAVFAAAFAAVSLLMFGLSPGIAHAQSVQIEWPTGEHNPGSAIVSWDHDDDNDDGVPDAEERPAPSGDRDNEIVSVLVAAPTAASVHVHASGHVRILTPAGAVEDHRYATSDGRASVELVGIAPSESPNDSLVTFDAGGTPLRVEITVCAAVVLRGDNSIVWAHRDAVGISHEITNNATLPRVARWDEASGDAENLRAEVWDPGGTTVGSVRFDAVTTPASIGMAVGLIRGAISDVMVDRNSAAQPFRSRFVRLVSDDIDLRAPGVQGQTLLVGLRDRVRVRYRRTGVAGQVTADVRVGRPGNEDGPRAARRARWHMVVMRDRPGGRPLIARDDAGAIRLAREQVTIANEIYAQCAITWGDPTQQAIDLADPPQGTLLAVADDDGLSASGGEVRLRVGGRSVGPVLVPAGLMPIETAERIADAIRVTGWSVRVTENRRTDYGSSGSADLAVRDERGRLQEFTAMPGAALTSDPTQSITIGRVDFNDGLEEFGNLNSAAGTLEERTLLKSAADDDRTTVDLFFINRFTRQTRIGEAFVEGDHGAVLNALIVDRAGVGAQREAWTQSHEAGHVLLNQPWHPDNLGPDRPWLLMDADASLASVTGPKRIAADECQRMHDQSGVGTSWPLLSRYDEVRASPRAREFREWPRTPPWNRPSLAATSTANAAVWPASPSTRSSDRPARAWGLRLE